MTRSGTSFQPLKEDVATTTPASPSVTPGEPAATANSERRDTEVSCSRYFVPWQICSMTISGEGLFLVEADHLLSTVPFVSARAIRKLLPPISTPMTCPQPLLAPASSDRRPMLEGPRLFLSIRRAVVWAMRNSGCSQAKLTLLTKLVNRNCSCRRRQSSRRRSAGRIGGLQ